MIAELKWKHDPVTNTWSYTITCHFHRKSYRKARWRKWMERAIKNDIKEYGTFYGFADGIAPGDIHWDMLMILK